MASTSSTSPETPKSVSTSSILQDPDYQQASSRTLASIVSLLDEKKHIDYRQVHHEPTFTSEESARARGEDISVGGKAIIMKLDDTYALFVISAARKLDSKKIKQKCAPKKMRFANVDELKSLTGGLVPGCVPPFGRPILPFDNVYVDESIASNQKIAFNAGSLTDSVIMRVDDYLALSQANVFAFSE